MRLLILGGTVFLGRALTDSALARGHEVAHLHRGRSGPDDPRVTTLHADRADAAAFATAIGTRSWDAVVDTSGYLPQVVRRSSDPLRERIARYLFVSSISVYASFERAGLDEDAPVAPPPDPPPETLRMELYGALKAACEAVVREAFGERATIVRPGLIAGPHDPTDRFTYWPMRIARGGEVVAPGRPARPVQFIDVRDVADFAVGLLERDAAGTFNATGPREPIAMRALLEACLRVASSGARLRWVAEEKLLEAQVAPWKDLPLWIPESDAAMRGMMQVSIARALAGGLSLRPPEATIADTLAWARARPADHAWKAGLTPERELALLDRGSS